MKKGLEEPPKGWIEAHRPDMFAVSWQGEACWTLGALISMGRVEAWCSTVAFMGPRQVGSIKEELVGSSL